MAEKRTQQRAERKRYRGTAVSVVQAKGQRAATPEGQFGRLAAPSQEAMRHHIEAGTCPWCGAGPYAILARHTREAHGVDGAELREMAGLLKNASICSAEHRKQIQERHAKNGTRPPLLLGPGSRTFRGLSTAGRAQKQAHGREVGSQVSPERRSELGRRGGAVRGRQLKKERQPCTICGEIVPYKAGNARKKTCSPECLTRAKVQAMMKAQAVSAMRRRSRQPAN